jgi:hypothetical protein
VVSYKLSSTLAGELSLPGSKKRSPFFSRAAISARPLRYQSDRELVYRPLQFHERSQFFIGADDETFSVAMRVNNPDRSSFNIQS